jgi:hypothetical protein
MQIEIWYNSAERKGVVYDYDSPDETYPLYNDESVKWDDGILSFAVGKREAYSIPAERILKIRISEGQDAPTD